MKAPSIREGIVPLGRFKNQASRYFRQVREGGAPVVVTHHGQAAGVVISPEDFDRFSERERFVAAVEEGLADVKAGRTISNEELTREFRRRFAKPRRVR